MACIFYLFVSVYPPTWFVIPCSPCAPAVPAPSHFLFGQVKDDTGRFRGVQERKWMKTETWHFQTQNFLCSILFTSDGLQSIRFRSSCGPHCFHRHSHRIREEDEYPHFVCPDIPWPLAPYVQSLYSVIACVTMLVDLVSWSSSLFLFFFQSAHNKKWKVK